MTNYFSYFSGREYNFIKRSREEAVDFGLPYDYNSVMHYRYKAFARKRGSPTLEPKHKEASKTMGQRIRMSKVDFAKLNRLYNCSGEYYRGDDLLGKTFIFGKVEKPKVRLDEVVLEESTGEDSEEIQQQSDSERKIANEKASNVSYGNSLWWKNLWNKVAPLEEDKINLNVNNEMNSGYLEQQGPTQGLIPRTKRQTSIANGGSGKSESLHPGNPDSFAPQKILPELLKGVLNSDNDRPIVIQFAIYQPIVYKSANESDSNNEENKAQQSNVSDNKKSVEKERNVAARQRDIYSSTEEQSDSEKQIHYQEFQREDQHNEEKYRVLQNSENYSSKPKHAVKALELPEILDKRISVDRKEYTLPSQLSFNENKHYLVTQTDYKITPKAFTQDQQRQEYQKDSPQLRAQKQIDTYYANESLSPTSSEVKPSSIHSRYFEADPANNPLDSGSEHRHFQSRDDISEEPNRDLEMGSDNYHTEHTHFPFDTQDKRGHQEDENFHFNSHLHEPVSNSEIDHRDIKEEVHSRENPQGTDHFEEPINEDSYSNHDAKSNEKVKEEPDVTFFQTERSVTEEKRPVTSNADGKGSIVEEFSESKTERKVSETKFKSRSNARDYDKIDDQELDNNRPQTEREPEYKFGFPPNGRNIKPSSQKFSEKVMKDLLSLQNSRNMEIIHEFNPQTPIIVEKFDREPPVQRKHDLFIEDDFTDELDKEFRKRKMEQMERVRKNEGRRTESRKEEEKIAPKISVSIERSQSGPKVTRKISSRKRESIDDRKFDNEGLIEKPKAAKLNLDPRQALPLQLLGITTNVTQNITLTK